MPLVELPPGVKATYRLQYRRCGKPGCSACGQGGQGHGPYWYAYWSEGGRMRPCYLGKDLPAEMRTPVSDVPPRHESGAPTSVATVLGDVVTSDALRVQTLGGFAVWRGDTPIPADRWNRRKVTTLFKCLLSAPGHRMHRESIIDLLWPDADLAEGAHSLRSTVHLLRQTLGRPAGSDQERAPYIRSDGEW